jgi:hypothetical protein
MWFFLFFSLSPDACHILRPETQQNILLTNHLLFTMHDHLTIVFKATKFMLIEYDGMRLCLRTAATNGPIFHSPGDMWAWRAMVMAMPSGDNSWLVHQSSLAVLLADTSRARNGRTSENFAYQYLKHLKGSLTCCKILHGTSGFTSHPKENALRIFIALKNLSLPGLNPRPLGPVASTLTTTSPRRLHDLCYVT